MLPSRSLALALAVAVVACSTSPTGLSVPPNIRFSAAPAVVAPGGTVQLSLTNAWVTPIAVVPCPLALQRWDGSAWVAKPTGILCAMIEDSVGPGGRYDRRATVDGSAVAGTYRAALMIQVGGGPMLEVYSNTFTVM